MAVNSKAIKRRMKSVGNTKKITKAMEMVSASKMRRTVAATLMTRPYALLARDLMERLSKTEQFGQPLLALRPVRKMLVILVTANRGLCGSFTTNLYKKMLNVVANPYGIATHRVSSSRVAAGEEIPQPVEPIAFDILGIGKKSAWIATKLNLNLIAVFDTLSERPSVEDVFPITALAIDRFVTGQYDKVVVAYMDYQSSLLQTPKVRQLLPISELDLDKMIGEGQTGIALGEYVFEPDEMSILTTILPRLVEVQVYQAILESAASEHSARMVAMRSATDAASDMLQELRINFNKARQAAITQEISEIVGGVAALST